MGKATIGGPPTEGGNVSIGSAGQDRLEYHGNVHIAGLSAAGKTTHAYLLAGTFGLTYVSGSQIHLGLNGLSCIQDRNFWVTPSAAKLATEEQFRLVDLELAKIEEQRRGCIFDSWISPWRRNSEGLSIYLKSSLESRAIKGAVSRRENGFVGGNQYLESLRAKDRAAIDLYRRMHGVDIESDLDVFDVVVDISDFISTPTLEASWSSIRRGHSILASVVGYYLTGKEIFLRRLRDHTRRPYMLRNRLLDG